MSINVTIGGNDRGDYIDRRSLSIVENLHSHANTASFDFYCSDVADAPVNGSEIIITDNSTKIFAGRILTKEEEFLPPNSHKYHVECIDYHRDLDRKLVNKTYTDQLTGDIVKDIISTYCSGLTTTNVSDGVTIDGSIIFDYMSPSDCIQQLAELSLYGWYIDYDKDLHFFTQAVPNAPFTIDDNQAYYKELKLSYDFSQLRNKVRVRGAGSINVTKQDNDSIAAIQAIEGGDGIYEHIINDETITTESLANKIADADLASNKDIYIKGEFLTDQTGVKAGQLIEVSSTKRNLNQNFFIQEVSLEKITIGKRETGIPYKPAEEAVIGYKPAVSAEEPYESLIKVYYIYRVTIASKLIDLASLLLDMLHQQGSILPSKDTTAPAVPSGLTLSTGMGLATQATLAWLKAEWSANTEADLSYYELRMKKSTDSDFTIVSTKNITFIFYSLEPGVTFNVYIRAIDISGNASDWSSLVSKTTATDSDTPAQLSAPTITAILAGIKITWNAGTEDNISHYKIERQESVNDVDWSGWSTIVNTDTTMWLDLLLTYTKYYRYRVSTVTQTGNTGNPSDPSNSVQPNKAGTSDIVALSITADLLAANSVYTNALQAGCVVTSKLKAGQISLVTIGSDYDWGNLPDDGHKPDDDADVTLSAINGELSITGGGIVLSSGSPKVRAGQTAYGTGTGFWLGLVAGTPKFSIGSSAQYLKWTGSALSIKGSITLINTIPNAKVDGLGALALEDSIAYGEITGTKPPSNADVTLSAIQGELSLAGGGLVLASAGAKIRGGQTAYGVGSGFWLGDVSGVTKLSIGNASNWLKWTGSALQIKGRLSVGANSNEDIYFEDSGIRLYDWVAGTIKRLAWKYGTLNFAALHYNTDGLTAFRLYTVNHTACFQVRNSDGRATFLCDSGYVNLWPAGTFQMANIANEPIGHAGDIAYNSTQHRFQMYVGGGTNAWGYELMSAGW